MSSEGSSQITHEMDESAAKAFPTPDAVSKACTLNVLDHKGNPVTFGSLFQDKKTIVVFVRHFFCGACQKYVTELSKKPLQSANVNLVVIGCGEWSPIDFYAETTGFTGPIYTDPSRELLRTLGMTVETFQMTPAGEQRKSYLGKSSTVSTLQSIGKIVTHPTLLGKQGNFKQIGGEFIFGPGEQCTFASRMRHTEDHMEVDELLKVADVQF